MFIRPVHIPRIVFLKVMNTRSSYVYCFSEKEDNALARPSGLNNASLVPSVRSEEETLDALLALAREEAKKNKVRVSLDMTEDEHLRHSEGVKKRAARQSLSWNNTKHTIIYRKKSEFQSHVVVMSALEVKFVPSHKTLEVLKSGIL